jgi:cytochrome c oxidase subunit 2
MNPNQLFVRDLVGVVLAIGAVTTAALWLGGPSRHEAQVGPVARAPAAADTVARSPAALGAQLYERKGCVACHSIDGSPRVGPSFKGSWGSQVVLGDGVTLVFDAAYLRESLAHPQAQARAGYPPSMPSFDGLLTDKEIRALEAFMQTLR